MRAFSFPAAFVVIGALLFFPRPACGQFFGAEPTQVQVGIGAAPGTGVEVSYVQPRTTFTFEAALYADVQSLFDAGNQRFQAAAAVGGSLRLLQMLRIVTGRTGEAELDVGLRTGPGLGFKANETPADKNRRFRLLLDPFARYVQPVGRLRLFAEAGLARPRLRVGLWFAL